MQTQRAMHPRAGRTNRRNSGSLPLSFEVHRTQAPADVLFLSRGRGYYLEPKNTGARCSIKAPDAGDAKVEMTFAGSHPERVEGAGRLPGVVNYYLVS